MMEVTALFYLQVPVLTVVLVVKAGNLVIQHVTRPVIRLATVPVIQPATVPVIQPVFPGEPIELFFSRQKE